MAAGADWNILNPPSAWQRKDVQLLYGGNDMSTGRPSFLRMAGGILVYPPFIVQVCSSSAAFNKQRIYVHQIVIAKVNSTLLLASSGQLVS